jgi:phosphohistidine swiveling domain-containing protein
MDGDQSVTYILQLREIGTKDLALAGGKGTNLGEMAVAGFPVPSGFVLTTHAYDAFVREHGLQGTIIDLASAISVDDSTSAEDSAAAIRALFLDAQIPAGIRSVLLAAYKELNNEVLNDDDLSSVDLNSKEEIAVAVRSSATAEDLPGASFAGQQESYLNVIGDEALIDAIKLCWASLWTARAMTYRLKQGIASADVSLAVVVQRMIPADLSGILFTAHPTSGDRSQMVINAGYGLGEAIVGGVVTPDSYLVDRARGTVFESTIGSKETKVVADEGQGVRREAVADTERKAAVLSSVRIQALAQTCQRIEAHFTTPQDIEWAFAGDDLWILQSRPITNLPPAPLTDVKWEPPQPGGKLIRRQVVEHMPGPLSPLFDELYLRVGLDRSTDLFLSEFDFDFDLDRFVERPMFVTANGYAYTRADYRLDPATLIDIVPGILQAYVKMLPSLIRTAIPRWRDRKLPAYQRVIDQWKTLDGASADDGQLWCAIQSLAITDATYWFEVSIVLGLAKVTDSLLNRYVGRLGRSGGETALTSGLFLRGFPSKTLEAQIDLEAIASQVRDSKQLETLVLETPPSALLAALENDPDGTEVFEAIQLYLDRYGHQIYTLDFAEPTQGEEPLPILVGLRDLVQEPGNSSQRQAKIAQEREQLATNVARSLPPLRRRIFVTLLNWAQKFGPYREDALFYIGAAWPVLRRLAHELGRRLVEDESLQEPDDIYYLSMAEIESTLVARATGQARPDFRTATQDRRTLREARKHLQPPPKIPDVPYKIGPIDMTIFETQKTKGDGKGNLTGFAVSPGAVTAPATIIRSPSDLEKMQPGTILVCPMTTPAWTPLFSQAGGLVTEIGGILAHGSIVAREYGIPAVMGVNGATRLIEDGQLITVDGNAGTVTLMA